MAPNQKLLRSSSSSMTSQSDTGTTSKYGNRGGGGGGGGGGGNKNNTSLSHRPPFQMEQALSADVFVQNKDLEWNALTPLLVLKPLQTVTTSDEQALWLRNHFCFTVPLVPSALPVRVTKQPPPPPPEPQRLRPQPQQYHLPHAASHSRYNHPNQGHPHDYQDAAYGVTSFYNGHGYLAHAPAPPPPPHSREMQLPQSIPQQQQQQQSLSGGLPIRVVRDDLDFAVAHRNRSYTPAQSNQYNKALPNLSKSLRDEVKSGHRTIPVFCDVLEQLLYAERRERLLMYERYSQYQHHKMTDGSHESEQYSWQAENTRWIEMEGIADAQPPVQVGDIVVYRPCQTGHLLLPSYLPPGGTGSIPNHPHSCYPPPPDDPTIGVFEVQTQVIQVVRAGPHVKVDRIQTTWLHDSQVVCLQMTHFLPLALTRPGLPCNIRIVENSQPLARCLTALDWLRGTLYNDNDEEDEQEQEECDHNDDNNNNNNNTDEGIKNTSGSTSNCANNPTVLQTNMVPALQELLFPTRVPSLPTVHNVDVFLDGRDGNDWARKLNPQQLSFVQVVLQRTLHPSTDHIRGPAILTGPAGTGKTRTMLTAILRLLALNDSAPLGQPRIRILVCAPSHTAANVITTLLGKHLQPSQLFRLLDASRPVNTVINSMNTDDPMRPFCSLQNGKFSLPSPELLLGFDVIVSTCSDAHLLYMSGCTNQQLRKHRVALYREAELKFRACGVAMPKTPLIWAPHFTHLFIDEAAQANEAESLIPVSVVADPRPGTRKVEVALSGDPRQLSPQVFCTKAADAGLGQSWIERLLRQPLQCTGGGSDTLLGPNQNLMEELLQYSFQTRETLSTFLTQNYRGHAAFLALPSALFYSDLLQCGHLHANCEDDHYWLKTLRMIEGLAMPVVCTTDDDGGDNVVLDEILVPRKQYGFPIHFRGIIGVDESATVASNFTSNSWANQKESKVVVEIITCLVSQHNGVPAVDPGRIGVMAPFRGQVDMIRRLLRSKGLFAVDVGTIEDYQAKEKDVIVLSVTRSTPWIVQKDIDRRAGLFGQPKRSNVALTRAEHLFIVVGNPNLMMEDFVWRQFVLFCHRNGLWYGEKMNETSLPSRRATVSANLEDLLQSEIPQKHNPATPMLGQPSSQTNIDGVVVSSLERLLRRSSII